MSLMAVATFSAWIEAIIVPIYAPPWCNDGDDDVFDDDDHADVAFNGDSVDGVQFVQLDAPMWWNVDADNELILVALAITMMTLALIMACCP